jgi:hypothetical protein
MGNGDWTYQKKKKVVMFLSIDMLPDNMPHRVTEGGGRRHSHFIILYLINEEDSCMSQSGSVFLRVSVIVIYITSSCSFSSGHLFGGSVCFLNHAGHIGPEPPVFRSL